MEAAGLRVRRLAGSVDGRPFDGGPRLYAVAERVRTQ